MWVGLTHSPEDLKVKGVLLADSLWAHTNLFPGSPASDQPYSHVPTAWANSWKKSLPLFICTPVGSIFSGKVRLIEMLMIYMLKTHKTVYGHTGI